MRSAVSVCSSGTVFAGIHDVSSAAAAMESCGGIWHITLLKRYVYLNDSSSSLVIRVLCSNACAYFSVVLHAMSRAYCSIMSFNIYREHDMRCLH